MMEAARSSQERQGRRTKALTPSMVRRRLPTAADSRPNAVIAAAAPVATAARAKAMVVDEYRRNNVASSCNLCAYHRESRHLQFFLLFVVRDMFDFG